MEIQLTIYVSYDGKTFISYLSSSSFIYFVEIFAVL